MITLFGGMSTEGHEESQDRLGGFNVYDADAYDVDIKAFYAGKSESGARNITVILAMPSGEYRETVYVTNRNGENFFYPKDKDGKEDKTKPKQTLPGWTLIEDIVLCAVGKELSQLAFEEKVMNVYDPDQKKEVPTAVQMATELLGSKVTVGLLKTKEFKQKKGDDGKYYDTDETRESNSLAKVFDYETKITVPEAREAQKKNIAPTADFYPKWVEKNKGKVIDKTTKGGNNGGKSGRPGGGSAPQAGEGQQRQSLFGKK